MLLDPISFWPRRPAPGWQPWALLLLFTAGGLFQPSPAEGQTEPTIGQEGKDVPWVPTPDVLVDTMLEMAEVSPDDLVVDLGSGDGRTEIRFRAGDRRYTGTVDDTTITGVARTPSGIVDWSATRTR